MTQLPEEGAVGGANDEPIIAAEPTLEDRLSAVMDEAPEENEQPAIEDGQEPELTAEDVPDEEADAPPIVAPVSWSAEAKEKFAQLPRDLQETVAQREAEREKFVQAKAQEAKTARSAVEREAFEALQQISAQHEQALQALLPQVPPRPAAMLQAEDPYAYAEQLDAHERAVAQYQWVQQRLQGIGQQRGHAEQQLRAQALQETQAVLEAQFPEYLDPVKGPELKNQLRSTALELGFSQEQLADVDHRDILAMKTATDWKAKAAKYDALMAQKMEGVRAAKTLPKVSRPGVPQGKGAVENQRYAADRQAMKGGDKDAAARVFSRFI